MRQFTVKIDGMGCERCVKKVTEALKQMGADVQSVQIGTAEFGFDGEEQAIRETVEECGFEVTSVSEK